MPLYLLNSLIDVSRMYTLESDIPPNSNTQTAFAVTLKLMMKESDHIYQLLIVVV